MASDDYSEERRRRRRRRRSSRERSLDEGRHGEEALENETEGEGSGERRRRRQREPVQRPEIKLRTLLVGAGILAGLAAVIAGGTWWYNRTYSPAALALAEMRSLPLVGLVIADESTVVNRLREAIAEEATNPTTQGPTRPMLIVNGLRQEFIAPAVRRADDATLLAAMAARAELVQHLRATNTAACREFSLGGIKDVEKLDAKGQELYKKLVTAMEAAYRSGHARKDGNLAMPNLQAMGAMLQEAGFTKPDFDKLNSFGSLSNDVSCDVELKLNQVPAKLPPDKRGAYARYILGN